MIATLLLSLSDALRSHAIRALDGSVRVWLHPAFGDLIVARLAGLTVPAMAGE